MIYMPKTKKAMKLCYEAHRDQTDKSGIPYVFHPIHVAEQMTDETTTVVALLHDVVEDTDYTLDDLRAMGFGEEAIDALALLTHREHVPYLQYVSQIKDNRTARAVKLADLRHNSDTSRLDELDEKAMARLEKYKAAIEILESCEEQERGTAAVKFNYKDLMEIFGDESKIELIGGEIVLGGKPFDDIVETYLRIKTRKQNESAT